MERLYAANDRLGRLGDEIKKSPAMLGEYPGVENQARRPNRAGVAPSECCSKFTSNDPICSTLLAFKKKLTELTVKFPVSVLLPRF